MTQPTREEALAHFGVKGMHWGVRKQQTSSENEIKSARTPEEKRALAKKVAIGTGILIAVAGAAAIGYSLSKNGKLPISSLNKATKKIGENTAKKVLEEPTQLIHFSKPSRESGAQSTGLRFIQKGGIKTFFEEMEQFENLSPNTMTRYGKQGEKIAVSLLDPKGRRDAAGRPVDHMIVIPKSMTQGINNIDDVREKIWPVLEFDYEDMVRRHVLSERMGR